MFRGTHHLTLNDRLEIAVAARFRVSLAARRLGSVDNRRDERSKIRPGAQGVGVATDRHRKSGSEPSRRKRSSSGAKGGTAAAPTRRPGLKDSDDGR